MVLDEVDLNAAPVEERDEEAALAQRKSPADGEQTVDELEDDLEEVFVIFGAD